LAWKAYFKFKGLEEEWKKLRTKQSKPDLRIPTDEEVLNTLKAACSSSVELCLVYRLLIESGARLSEVIKILNEYDPTRLKDHKSFYTYALAHMRGRKYSFYIFSITKPLPFKCSENWVSNWAAKNKMVNPKYVRKWVATKMLGIGIPSEIVNFIQGRTPTSILEKNYLNLYSLAMQYYPRYIELLKKMNL
jgi:intergrase/recombinase